MNTQRAEMIMSNDTTNPLVEMLIRHEGLRLHAYKDTKKLWTIGIGRNLQGKGLSDEELEFCHLTPESLNDPGSIKITKKDAYHLLYNDITDIENQLRRYRWYNPLDRVRKDVIVDMCFMGVEKVCNPVTGFREMTTALCVNDYKKAANEIIETKGRESKYLLDVKGRAMELSMMMHSGVYLSKEQLYLISARKY